MNGLLLKELVALLLAGSRIVPLADNDDVYRSLEERLDELRAAGEPANDSGTDSRAA